VGRRARAHGRTCGLLKSSTSDCAGGILATSTWSSPVAWGSTEMGRRPADWLRGRLVCAAASPASAPTAPSTSSPAAAAAAATRGAMTPRSGISFVPSTSESTGIVLGSEQMTWFTPAGVESVGGGGWGPAGEAGSAQANGPSSRHTARSLSSSSDCATPELNCADAHLIDCSLRSTLCAAFMSSSMLADLGPSRSSAAACARSAASSASFLSTRKPTATRRSAFTPSREMASKTRRQPSSGSCAPRARRPGFSRAPAAAAVRRPPPGT
jgi:hypothetical protein